MSGRGFRRRFAKAVAEERARNKRIADRARQEMNDLGYPADAVQNRVRMDVMENQSIRSKTLDHVYQMRQEKP